MGRENPPERSMVCCLNRPALLSDFNLKILPLRLTPGPNAPRLNLPILTQPFVAEPSANACNASHGSAAAALTFDANTMKRIDSVSIETFNRSKQGRAEAQFVNTKRAA
jgi:hypothetical protein